ncbi:MAG: cytochrome c biogenesis protein ResB [Bacteroidales bacterium]|nr:cytochrome c biogenesis protein ResB [Bacteroidales bacterium]
MAENNNSEKRKFLKFPWDYKESFMTAFTLLLCGFAVNYFSFPAVPVIPAFPYNLYFLICVLIYIFFSGLYFKSPFIKWLSSIPAAISAISVFTFLILLMGFIPQQREISGFISRTGLSHITQSWSFLIISFYLMLILGYAIIKRSYPLNIKNIRFFLNHAGLWIVIAAASMGSADMMVLEMQAETGKKTSVVYDQKGKFYKLPFEVELKTFEIDEYLPHRKKITSILKIYDDNEIYDAAISVNHPVKIHDWKFYLKSYDKNMGQWSVINIFKIVRDPWLPVVYAGIIMMLAGVLLLFWKTNKN